MKNTIRHITIAAPYAKPPETWETCVGNVILKIGNTVVGITSVKNGNATVFPGNNTRH